MISKGNREQSGLEQVLMKYISKNICCVMTTVRIHLPPDDMKPKGWRRSVLEDLQIMLYCPVLGGKLSQAAEITLTPQLSNLICQQQQETENIPLRGRKVYLAATNFITSLAKALYKVVQEPSLPTFLYNFKYNSRAKLIANHHLELVLEQDPSLESFAMGPQICL
ncbi:hypothetical protein WISP_27817 [Willisornis vidua]|uniref:Uncharacterized protein n=1 Tax=Willisornis vidua TaxID=1566151 RepID=A0ABQ9DS36_9PASS|nr:hypothetical protein WISP_27817 [Willisornis vidua]